MALVTTFDWFSTKRKTRVKLLRKNSLKENLFNLKFFKRLFGLQNILLKSMFTAFFKDLKPVRIILIITLRKKNPSI